MAEKKKWNYHPLHERMADTAIAAVAGTGYAIALSQIFNPVALGLAGAFIWTIAAIDRRLKTDKKAYVEKLIERGYIKPIYQQTAFQNFVDEEAEKMDLPPHRVFIATDKFLKRRMPVLLRNMSLTKEMEHAEKRSTVLMLAAGDAILTTKEFLNDVEAPLQRFVAAHELSHAKTRDLDSYTIKFSALSKKATKFLTYGIFATAGASLLGYSGLSVFAEGIGFFYGCAVMMVTAAATGACVNTYKRMYERRADRNAVYNTRDLQSGIDMLMLDETENEPESTLDSLLTIAAEPFQTHPSPQKRVANMKRAFEKASQYPPAESTAAKVPALPTPIL